MTEKKTTNEVIVLDNKEFRLTETYSGIKILSGLSREEIEKFNRYLQYTVYSPEDTVITEGDNDREMFFILEGEAAIRRNKMDLGTISKGSHFGELGMIEGRMRSATVKAATRLYLAKLTSDNYQRMLEEEPSLGVHLMQILVATLGRQLTEMTDSIEYLLQQRSIPRRVNVEVNVDGEKRMVRTGTPVGSLLPDKCGNYPVVAALLDNKAVSLSSPVTSSVNVFPLTTENWEGERIYRHSAVLLLLEASSEIDPNVELILGVSLGETQWIDIKNHNNTDLKDFCSKLKAKMHELIERNITFREEWWEVEEARSYFIEHGYTESARLLHTWREATVPLVSCGRVYAVSPGPLLSHAGIFENFDLKVSTKGLVLNVGEKTAEAMNNNSNSSYVDIMREHDLWLNSLGVDSVGKFNQVCVDGKVSQLIQVAEGFHEKSISQIADKIAFNQNKARVICIAGPSSSGKTTFIKRLKIQLQVNGMNPLSISLDDYYHSRSDLIPNEKGDYNFEELAAFNTNLLKNHISRLIKGEKVKTAKYNFVQSKSYPEGGEEIQLTDKNILLIEGIHGLNPALLDSSIETSQLFRIFIQPMASLPFDHLSRVNPSDLRLLRRIVRDRHQRGYSAWDNIMRWEEVRAGEREFIFPYISQADVIFDTSLIYEISVLKVYAERYLLEIPEKHPSYMTAYRLRKLIDRFIAIYPDHVPPTSILREFIGNSGFEY